jgi:hypothetical protein
MKWKLVPDQNSVTFNICIMLFKELYIDNIFLYLAKQF